MCPARSVAYRCAIRLGPTLVGRLEIACRPTSCETSAGPRFSSGHTVPHARRLNSHPRTDPRHVRRTDLESRADPYVAPENRSRLTDLSIRFRPTSGENSTGPRFSSGHTVPHARRLNSHLAPTRVRRIAPTSEARSHRPASVASHRPGIACGPVCRSGKPIPTHRPQHPLPTSQLGKQHWPTVFLRTYGSARSQIELAPRTDPRQTHRTDPRQSCRTDLESRADPYVAPENRSRLTDLSIRFRPTSGENSTGPRVSSGHTVPHARRLNSHLSHRPASGASHRPGIACGPVCRSGKPIPIHAPQHSPPTNQL